MARQERQSILCPNCRKLISLDESPCPYCGIAAPGARWKHSIWTRGFFDGEQLIRTIIFANVAVYLISILIDPRSSFMSSPLFLSPTNRSLLVLGATGTIPIDQLHRWWSLLSANYLHGSILHILLNMFAFRQLARFTVHEYGANRMFIIYTLGGMTGFLISYLAGVPFTIGASAAVFSLIGAALYYGKSRGGLYGQAIYRQIGGWAVGLLLLGFALPGINNWGHAGGLGAGVILGFVLGYQEKTREALLHRVLAGACALLTITILGWAVLSGILQSL